MPVPLPSDYLPFDSNAPGAMKHSRIDIYVNLAVVTLVLYDHVITLGMETERIWSLRWGLPKFLFLTSRYVIPPLLMVAIIGRTSYPLLLSFCNFDAYFHRPVQALSLVIAELVLLIRVFALYEHSKVVLSFLVGLFICQLAAVIVEIVFNIKISTLTLYYEFLPGCWEMTESSEGTVGWSSSRWIPFICFDGILLILTLIKVFSYRNSFNPTIRLLARDSVFFFALIFLCLVENILVSTIGTAVNVDVPTEWVACIAVSRMTMNIRGLVTGGLGSTHAERSTMVFRNRPLVEYDTRGMGTELTVVV